MAKRSFVPRLKEEVRPFLNNFADKLLDSTRGFATKYNIKAGDVTALDHGRKWVNWTLDNSYAGRVAAVSFTQFKDELFTGKGGITGVLNAPIAAVYTDVPKEGTPPAMIPPVADVLGLAAAIGKQIKNSTNYDPADGTALGLEGAEELLPNVLNAAPDLGKSHITSGGRVEIVWVKGDFSALRIEVDRGDGQGFRYLTTDTEPDYVDTVKPAAGMSAVYRYRAIYLLGDEEFGQWSQVFEISVRG